MTLLLETLRSRYVQKILVDVSNRQLDKWLGIQENNLE